MKRLILSLALLLTLSIFTIPERNVQASEAPAHISLENIEDGWYKAKVDYFNYNTGTRNTYTLNVKVEYNTVTVIDFGNGGSVHSGYNNSGYVYSGGFLSFQRDLDYSIISAYGSVQINLENGNIITYDIRIG